MKKNLVSLCVLFVGIIQEYWVQSKWTSGTKIWEESIWEMVNQGAVEKTCRGFLFSCTLLTNSWVRSSTFKSLPMKLSVLHPPASQDISGLCLMNTIRWWSTLHHISSFLFRHIITLRWTGSLSPTAGTAVLLQTADVYVARSEV